MFGRRRRELHDIRAQADAARDRKDWVTAALYYSRYLETPLGRTNAPIWVQLGHALKESGARSQARTAYNQAILVDPGLADARLQLGHLLKLDGETAAALDSYQMAHRLDPNLRDAQIEIDRLDAAEPRSPAPPKGAGSDLRALGDRARDDSDWTAASVFYRAYLADEAGESDAPTWAQLGRVYKSLGQLSKALECYYKALEIAPDSPETYTELGHVHRAMGQRGKARAAYRHALTLDPEYTDAKRELERLASPRGATPERKLDLDQQQQVADRLELVRYRDRLREELERAVHGLASQYVGPVGSPIPEEETPVASLPKARIVQLKAQLTSSVLFDEPWYRSEHQLADDVDALEHFCEEGATRGFAPHPLFDISWYGRVSGYNAASGVTPIEHYLSTPPGARASTHPLFHRAWYGHGLHVADLSTMDVLEHFLTWGDIEGRSPHPLFNSDWYRTRNSVDIPDYAGVLRHYLTTPHARLAQTHPYFDGAYYLANSAAARASELAPLVHYVLYGEADNALPHPAFSPLWYLTSNGDVASGGSGALEHFVTNGVTEGRSPGPGFPSLEFKQVFASEPVWSVDALARLMYGPVDDLWHDIGWIQTAGGKRTGANASGGDIPDLFALDAATPTARIAVLAYVFYPDVWEELAEAASAIPEAFDLFVVLVAGHSDHLAGAVRSRYPSARVLTFPNRGRDILSFVMLLNSGVLFRYELLCKLHTKKSPHRDDGPEWRRLLTDGVLKDQESVTNLLAAFRSDADLAVVVADGNIAGDDPGQWTSNAAKIGQMCGRLGLPAPTPDSRFPAGSIYWVRPWTLRSVVALGLTHEEFEAEPLPLDGTLPHAIERFIGLLITDAGMRIAETSDAEALGAKDASAMTAAQSKVHQVAFYLPQYHPIAENDEWWGKGFTEWTNVTRAKPQFAGHRQPRLPGELGFYDLRLKDTAVAQAALAAEYGISAFCYYHYWFDGRTILDRPVNDLVASSDIRLPFFLCWANEPWTRSWDGKSQNVLLPQTYLETWERKFAGNVARYMRDGRYLKLDGRPLLFIYRVMHMPSPGASLALIRQALRDEGVGEIHLGGGWVEFEDDDPLPAAPEALGLDSYFEFPPHRLPLSECVITGTRFNYNADFAGQVFDYEQLIATYSGDDPQFQEPSRFPTAMMGWDNTARRGSKANVFVGATPGGFRRWLRLLVNGQRDLATKTGKERLVLINAWNEWAEGTYLEPDQTFGRGWLEAVRSAIGPKQTH